LGDQVVQQAFGYLGVFILDQFGDDADVAGIRQGLADLFRQGLAHGDGQLVGLGAMAHQFDQVGVVENHAVDQQRMGDLDLIIRQDQDEFLGRVVALGEPRGDVLTHRYLNLVDELAQNVAHERAFALAQAILLLQE
jgi:hypothetical protein